MRTHLPALFLSLSVIYLSCQADSTPEMAHFDVTIRLPTEPDMLNPARSASSYATQVESQIFFPLAEMDPFDYTLTPLLIESIPDAEKITSGPDSGGVRFAYTIRKEAQWQDGQPVTGYDYAFTMKMALDPQVDVAQWRGFLTLISDVRVDSANPRKFVVTIGEQYILADLIACNFNIYPKHIYDAEGFLDGYTVRALTDPTIADSLARTTDGLRKFADQFMQSRFANEVVVGSGPYQLTSWETGQRIILDKVSSWWGAQLSQPARLLQAYPDRLIYEFVPDENTALTMVKDGTIDVMSEVSPGSFVQLRNDPAYADVLNFFTPKLNVYYSLLLNNHRPLLQEKAIRKALACILDYDGVVNQLAQGMGARTVGPFHPDVEYYNHDLTPVPFDLDLARQYLSDDGWSDSDGDGILDKVIAGQRTPLALTMTTTQSALGQGVGLLMQENARKVGIEITLITRDGASFNQDLRARNFDIATARNDSPITLADPYQSWHSDSDAPGGGNRSGFRNARADSLILVIRGSDEAAQRNAAYVEFQSILADEQPVIFLYTPLERIIVSKRFEMQTSARRPGYFEQLFQLSHSPANDGEKG